jgi:hypothetical protein
VRSGRGALGRLLGNQSREATSAAKQRFEYFCLQRRVRLQHCFGDAAWRKLVSLTDKTNGRGSRVPRFSPISDQPSNRRGCRPLLLGIVAIYGLASLLRWKCAIRNRRGTSRLCDLQPSSHLPSSHSPCDNSSASVGPLGAGFAWQAGCPSVVNRCGIGLARSCLPSRWALPIFWRHA